MFLIFKLKKRRLALESRSYNLQDAQFCELFPDIADEIREILAKENVNNQSLTNQSTLENKSQATNASNSFNQAYNWRTNVVGNLFVILGLAIFAFVVKYVFSTIN